MEENETEEREMARSQKKKAVLSDNDDEKVEEEHQISDPEKKEIQPGHDADASKSGPETLPEAEENAVVDIFSMRIPKIDQNSGSNKNRKRPRREEKSKKNPGKKQKDPVEK